MIDGKNLVEKLLVYGAENLHLSVDDVEFCACFVSAIKTRLFREA